ncbi:MAG: LCP family protein [Nocardioides sp.]
MSLELAAFVAVAVLIALAVLGAVAFWRGHRRIGTGLLVLVLLAVGGSGAYAWQLGAKVGDIERVKVPAGFDTGRPPDEPGQALTVLLLGTDNPHPREDKPTVAELLAASTWNPGAYRSDSLMLVRIAADRRSAEVVSIPRDSYVPILDAEGVPHGSNKINAAFSLYGPFGTVRTVEELTGMHIDHLAIVDFEGFRDLTTALGGVDVYVPEHVYDPYQKQDWPQGWNHIEGDLALKYVRMRHNLAQGDFDRVRRQQNFLRAVLTKLTDAGTLANPLTVGKVVDAVVGNLTVDDRWTDGDIRGLAIQLRHLRRNDIVFATLPLDHYETIPGVGDANILDPARVRELFGAVQRGRLSAYLEKYPEDGLAGEKGVR